MSTYSFDLPQPSMWPTPNAFHNNERRLHDQNFLLIENVYQGHLDAATDYQRIYNTAQSAFKQNQGALNDFSNCDPSSSLSSSLTPWPVPTSLPAPYHSVPVALNNIEPNYALHNYPAPYQDPYLNNTSFANGYLPPVYNSSLSRTPSLSSWSGSDSPATTVATPEATQQNHPLQDYTSFYNEPYFDNNSGVVAGPHANSYPTEFDANGYPLALTKSQTYMNNHLGDGLQPNLNYNPKYSSFNSFTQLTGVDYAAGGAAMPQMSKLAFPNPVPQRPPSSFQQPDHIQPAQLLGPGAGFQPDGIPSSNELQPSSGPLRRDRAAAKARKSAPYKAGAPGDQHSTTKPSKKRRKVSKKKDSGATIAMAHENSVMNLHGAETERFCPSKGETKTEESIIFNQANNLGHPSSGSDPVEQDVNPNSTHGRRSIQSHHPDFLEVQGGETLSDSIKSGTRKAEKKVALKKKKVEKKEVNTNEKRHGVGQGYRADKKLSPEQNLAAMKAKAEREKKDTSAPDESENHNSPKPITRPDSAAGTKETAIPSNPTSSDD